MTDSLSRRHLIRASGIALGSTALPIAQIGDVMALCREIEGLDSPGELARASASA